MPKLPEILEYDLLTSKATRYLYTEKDFASYLSGRGFNVAYLNRELPVNQGPLDSENIIVFSCGLLTGEQAPVASRLHINAQSPLTGILGSSNIGGNIGYTLRSAGVQTLIVRGRAEKPVYLVIGENQISVRSAAQLWGMDTWQTQKRLHELHPGKNVQIMTIGPAGENLVHFAAIIGDGDHAAGRTGMGAVMGSKNLKAIVIEGSNNGSRKLAQESRLIIREFIRLIRSSSEFEYFSTYGGAGYIKWANDLGILATHNFRHNHTEPVDCIEGSALAQSLVKRKGCRGCPVKCKADLKIGGKTGQGYYVRPEFESIANLGPKCGQNDLNTVVHHDNQCTRLGLDTISTGNVLAFAMDLYQRGILTREDCNGLDLSWGNRESMTTLINDIACCRGFGSLLSKGVREMAHQIGKGAERYAPHVKGLELSAYHPYHIMGTALGYAISSRGGDFSSVYASLEYSWTPEQADLEFGSREAVNIRSIKAKASLVRRAAVVNAVLDCLGICKVPSLSLIGRFDLFAESKLIEAFFGRDISPAELFTVGERIITTKRYINTRFGITERDDNLPEMFYSPEYNGEKEAKTPGRWIEIMKQQFYQEMGWNKNGIPTIEKLQELDIETPDQPQNPAA